MLEGRKLSIEMQRNSNSRVWTILSLLISLACVLLLASLWIGLTIAPPAPDKSQDNMAQAHAKALEGIDKLKSGLAADQALTPELFAEMAELVPVLDGFAQASAKATQAAADSRDAQIWPGRANLILDDLNTLILAKEPILNFLRTRDALSALYKPKGAISLNSIAAVFKDTQASTSESAHLQLDVAVHDGSAIFMKAFSECFALSPNPHIQPSSELPQWVIVLSPPMSSATGCRVQSVVGPFWAKAGLASLDHDGQSWSVVYRSGEMSIDMPRDMSGEAHA